MRSTCFASVTVPSNDYIARSATDPLRPWLNWVSARRKECQPLAYKVRSAFATPFYT